MLPILDDFPRQRGHSRDGRIKIATGKNFGLILSRVMGEVSKVSALFCKISLIHLHKFPSCLSGINKQQQIKTNQDQEIKSLEKKIILSNIALADTVH